MSLFAFAFQTGTVMRALAIVPTYNERDNLPPLIDALLALEPPLDLLVIDDNSPDGTGRIADGLAARSDRVQVLHRAAKEGLGRAYIAGFQYALERSYDSIIHMDADFSHRPEDVPRLLRALDDADVVVGSRRISGGRTIGWSPTRQLVSAWGSIYARLVLGLRLKDCTGGFKCMRRRALQALDLTKVRSNGYAFHVELNYAWSQAGLRIIEVPIVFPDRVRGVSKMSAAIALEAATLLWKLRFHGGPAAAVAEPGPAPSVARAG
jgi:dolichol-phosphate mannosyltransferase